jgi:hypothetical protein
MPFLLFLLLIISFRLVVFVLRRVQLSPRVFRTWMPLIGSPESREASGPEEMFWGS